MSVMIELKNHTRNKNIPANISNTASCIINSSNNPAGASVLFTGLIMEDDVSHSCLF
jgi:hypothetical protein